MIEEIPDCADIQELGHDCTECGCSNTSTTSPDPCSLNLPGQPYSCSDIVASIDLCHEIVDLTGYNCDGCGCQFTTSFTSTSSSSSSSSSTTTGLRGRN